MTWDQATEYCQKLTKLDREAGVLPDDWQYRLPTEAEWEYACRTRSSEPRHGPPQEVAWYHGADLERLNRDYGSTALTCAVIRRQKNIIRTLFKRSADPTDAMHDAQRGLAGDYEDEPSLDREGYREIIELLRELGVGSNL